MVETLRRWGLSLAEGQRGKLDIFMEELLEKNARFNLFSGNDAGHLWTRHILDALAGAQLLSRLVKPCTSDRSW